MRARVEVQRHRRLRAHPTCLLFKVAGGVQLFQSLFTLSYFMLYSHALPQTVAFTLISVAKSAWKHDMC